MRWSPCRIAALDPEYQPVRSPLRSHHFAILLLVTAVIVMAFLLEVRADGRVFFRFAPERVLPHTCASKVLFNADCAGCGLTRSFIHLAAFRPVESWRVHRAGWMMALLVVGQVPYRIMQLRRLMAGEATPVPLWSLVFLGLVFVAIYAHWGLRLFGF